MQQQSEKSATIVSEHRVSLAGEKDQTFITITYEGDDCPVLVEIAAIDVTSDDIDFLIDALKGAKAEIEWRKSIQKGNGQ